MDLGTFSLSLNVKNLETSLAFYKTIGFKVVDGGHINDAFKDTGIMKWRILEHPSVKIGLFQGMFEHNILTFSPTDIMSIQEVLKKKKIPLNKEVKQGDPTKSIMFSDPDGNEIMLDQH